MRFEHCVYFCLLVEVGFFKVSGLYVGADRDSALLIFSADNVDQVRALVADDPMSVNDVLDSLTITEWNPLLGVFAS